MGGARRCWSESKELWDRRTVMTEWEKKRYFYDLILKLPTHEPPKHYWIIRILTHLIFMLNGPRGGPGWRRWLLGELTFKGTSYFWVLLFHSTSWFLVINPPCSIMCSVLWHLSYHSKVLEGWSPKNRDWSFWSWERKMFLFKILPGGYVISATETDQKHTKYTLSKTN